jgi:hypothetical protein
LLKFFLVGLLETGDDALLLRLQRCCASER